MTTALQTETDVERNLVQILRERSVSKIEEIGIERAAEILRVSEFAVDSLLSRRGWSLEEAMRVSVALGILDTQMTRLLSETLS